MSDMPEGLGLNRLNQPDKRQNPAVCFCVMYMYTTGVVANKRGGRGVGWWGPRVQRWHHFG